MGHEQPREFSLAEEALARIKAAGLAPDPTTFEVWFTYVSGQNQALNRDMNALIEAGALSANAVQCLYTRHLSPNRHLEHLFVVGDTLSNEAHQVADLISSACGSTQGYDVELQTASRQLDSLSNPEAVSAIVNALIRSTEEIRHTNAILQEQLKSSETQVRLLQEKIEILRVESMTDPLTAVANRKLFDHSLKQMVERAESTDTPLSLVLADIDGFKNFNDQFGHQIGDDVLRLVAFAIKNSVRGGDLIARYGGDEFAVLLPRTALKDALAVGENIRRAVMDRELVRRSTQEKLGRMTLSIGVAQHQTGESSDAVVGRADRRLYVAKQRGRNCVIGEDLPRVTAFS